MDCNLSPHSLVIILNMELIKEICLNSFTIDGVWTLGTRVMKELLIVCRSIFSLKKSKHS
jgi:hypothetical protein